MTVGELIRVLSQFDPEAEAVVEGAGPDGDGGVYAPVEAVINGSILLTNPFPGPVLVLRDEQ
jgi:hypothetical protein